MCQYRIQKWSAFLLANKNYLLLDVVDFLNIDQYVVTTMCFFGSGLRKLISYSHEYFIFNLIHKMAEIHEFGKILFVPSWIFTDFCCSLLHHTSWTSELHVVTISFMVVLNEVLDTTFARLVGNNYLSDSTQKRQQIWYKRCRIKKLSGISFYTEVNFNLFTFRIHKISNSTALGSKSLTNSLPRNCWRCTKVWNQYRGSYYMHIDNYGAFC